MRLRDFLYLYLAGFLLIGSWGGLVFAQEAKVAKGFAELTIKYGNEAIHKFKVDVGKQLSTALKELVEPLKKGDLVIHQGADLPESWMKELTKNEASFVRVSSRSPNTAEEQPHAIQLGDQGLRPPSLFGQVRTRIFNGLPQAKGQLRGRWELWRMDLPISERAEWQRVQDNVQQTLRQTPFSGELAKKASLIQGLKSHDYDVVVLIAHNDGAKIYLPDGKSISREELDQIRLPSSPDRVIVLITCRAGQVNADTVSWAERVLRNKLAKTVFASPVDVDASKVPQLLHDLLTTQGILGTSPLRPTLQRYGFIQVVRDSVAPRPYNAVA